MTTSIKEHHFELVDLIDKDDDLEKEQTVLDKHDDDVRVLSIHLQALLTPAKTTASRNLDNHKLFSCKLYRLESGLGRIDSRVSTIQLSKGSFNSVYMLASRSWPWISLMKTNFSSCTPSWRS